MGENGANETNHSAQLHCLTYIFLTAKTRVVLERTGRTLVRIKRFCSWLGVCPTCTLRHIAICVVGCRECPKPHFCLLLASFVFCVGISNCHFCRVFYGTALREHRDSDGGRNRGSSMEDNNQLLGHPHQWKQWSCRRQWMQRRRQQHQRQATVAAAVAAETLALAAVKTEAAMWEWKLVAAIQIFIFVF